MYNLIISKLKQNQIEEAENIAIKLFNKDKNNHKINYLLGQINYKNKKYKYAEKFYKKAILLNKHNERYFLSLGNLYLQLENFNKSILFFKKAILINKKFAIAINNIAYAYSKQGRYKKTIKNLLLALDIEKNNHYCMYNLGNAYKEIDELDNANKYYDKALKFQPQNKHYLFNKSFVLLKKRNYKKAWQLYENRIGIKNNESKVYKIIKDKIFLNKELNDGDKLAIIPEQGIGDEILFSSMYMDFIDLYPNSIIFIDKRLKPVFARSFKFKNFHSVSNLKKIKSISKKGFKFIYAASLGKFFRNNINDFKKSKFLIPNNKRVNLIKKQLAKYGNKKIIGLSWYSQSKSLDQKSIELKYFKPLLQNKNFIFINLQYGKVQKEINKFNKMVSNKIISLNNIDLFHDFESLIALIANLDLVITIDNINAQISGSIGKKTWVITPYTNEYILYSRSNNGKSDWYPSNTIFYNDGKKKNIINTITKLTKKLKKII